MRDFIEKIKNYIFDIAEKFLLWMGKKVGTGNNTKRTWHKIRKASIYTISIVLTLLIIIISGSAVLSNLFGKASLFNNKPVLFSINSGASMSYVAAQLKEAGLIKSSLGIKLLADFTSVSSKIQSGEYILTKTMTPQQILDVITRPKAVSKVVAVTLVEGQTLETFAQVLGDNGIIDSSEDFLKECQNIEKYAKDYSFLESTQKMTNLRYFLEGYMFPDTYEFYTDSTAQVVINKLLSRFETIYSTEIANSAKKLGLSTHEVLTLASLIEKEGKTDDFTKISAVFHNRLKKNMKLESDVTVQYALNVKRLVLTSDELKTDSPYNTYVVNGLPAGPICNPSKNAISAAVNPDKDILAGDYLYFTLTDPYTGEVAYSKTYDEHLALKNKYQSAWAKYDKEHG